MSNTTKGTRQVPETTSTTISLPSRAKPSKACSTDKTRPVLMHAYLRKCDDRFELHVTDSYCAVRIPVNVEDEGTVAEGFVPQDALKEIERDKHRAFGASNGRIELDGGRVSYRRGEHGTFPDFEKLWAAPAKKPLVIGLNTKILRQVAEAMGSDAVKFELDLSLVKNGTYLRPFRISPLVNSVDAEGLVMPIRVNT